MEQFLALALESRGTVRHYSFALCRPDLAAEVCFARLAKFALAAFGGAEGRMISNAQRLNSGNPY